MQLSNERENGNRGAAQQQRDALCMQSPGRSLSVIMGMNTCTEPQHNPHTNPGEWHSKTRSIRMGSFNPFYYLSRECLHLNLLLNIILVETLSSIIYYAQHSLFIYMRPILISIYVREAQQGNESLGVLAIFLLLS